MYCIYRIRNKINGHTYIGQHRYNDLSTDNYMGSGKLLRRAIGKYGIENFEREILISEVKTREEINELEIKYIESERDLGHGEYNISRGGDGGWFLSGENHPWYGKHLSEEHKKKLSESHKRENLSEETRKKLSEARKGKSLSEEIRLKISESHRGKLLSEEIRLKMSESRRGKNHYLYGQHLSEETRNKISEAKKGKHLSKEHRKKISEAREGKPRSEETRLKISYSAKLRIGKRYYNNGIECHMYEPGKEPEGYVLGKL